MTVPNEIDRSGPYSGNGVTTVFDYDFRIADEDHIRVIKLAGGVETTLTIDADYIVSDVGNPGGGQIATTVAPATGETITLLRNVPFTQETDLENQGAYFAETVEAALDLAAMRDQQLSERLDRAVVIPASSDSSDLAALVADVLRLADSADAVDTVAGISADVEAVAAISGDVTTVAGIAANVSTVADIAASVPTVAGIEDEVVAVAGNATNINTVAGDSDEINALAAISGDVTTVAGVSDDVSTVADNIVDVTNFADVYQGPKAAAPSTRNDGSALQKGDLYFNTSIDLMQVRGSTEWRDTAGTPLNISVKSFVGDGVTTAFTLNVSPGSINNLLVEIGGVLQVPVADYTISDATLTLSSAPPSLAAVNTWVIATTVTLNIPADGSVVEASVSDDPADQAAIRGKIGASSATDVSDLAAVVVRHSVQALTPPQQVQAMTNIGAPLKYEYVSALQTIVTQSQLTLATGFPTRPKIVEFSIVCQTTEHGYSVGTEIVVAKVGSADGGTGSFGHGFELFYEPGSDDINVLIGGTTGGLTPLLLHKTTKALVSITVANWKLKVRALA